MTVIKPLMFIIMYLQGLSSGRNTIAEYEIFFQQKKTQLKSCVYKMIHKTKIKAMIMLLIQPKDPFDTAQNSTTLQHRRTYKQGSDRATTLKLFLKSWPL